MNIIPLFEIKSLEDRLIKPMGKSVYSYIDSFQTPEEISQAISDKEKEIANRLDKNKEGYLDCDEATDIMGYFLKKKDIRHKVIIGKSDEGSSHAYIKIGDKRYDPTNQGFGDMKDEWEVYSF